MSMFVNIVIILFLIYVVVMKFAEYNWIRYMNRRGYE
jgi:hypothetical protein